MFPPAVGHAGSKGRDSRQRKTSVESSQDGQRWLFELFAFAIYFLTVFDCHCHGAFPILVHFFYFLVAAYDGYNDEIITKA